MNENYKMFEKNGKATVTELVREAKELSNGKSVIFGSDNLLFELIIKLIIILNKNFISKI